jgi:uncharacterized membrane protein
MLILSYIGIFASALATFALLDLLWVGVAARTFYRSAVGHLMSDHTHFIAGLIFYLVYVSGLVFFAIFPALLVKSFFGAGMLAALYGFFTYATYDLTNYATLRDWPLRVVVVDLMWGVAASAMAGLAAFAFGTLIL